MSFSAIVRFVESIRRLIIGHARTATTLYALHAVMYARVFELFVCFVHIDGRLEEKAAVDSWGISHGVYLFNPIRSIVAVKQNHFGQNIVDSSSQSWFMGLVASARRHFTSVAIARSARPHLKHPRNRIEHFAIKRSFFLASHRHPKMCGRFTKKVLLLIQLAAVVSALPLPNMENPDGDSIDDIVSMLKLRVDGDEIKRALRSLVEKANAKQQEAVHPAIIDLAKRQDNIEDNNSNDYNSDADNYYDYDAGAMDLRSTQQSHEDNDFLMQSDVTDTDAGNEDMEYLRRYQQSVFDDFGSLLSADQTYDIEENDDDESYDY